MIRILRALPLLLPLSAAWAGNGLNDIGYGSESAALAGTDLALARDTTALNTNPAGLTQIRGQILDVLIEPYVYHGVEHTDSVGNGTRPDNWYGTAIGGGYARRLADSVVVGAGLFFQGGAGFVYRDFATSFGNRDELSGLSGSIKIAPGLAWQIDERWSVGAAVGFLYSNSRQKFFPDTSTAEFSGFRVDDLHGISVNFKTGLQYRPSADWVFALAYTSKAPVRLEDGTMTFNHSGSGGGRVTYRDVRLTGLAFAQDVGVGFLYRVDPALSLVGELTWLDWASAMEGTRLRARRPDDASAPAVVTIDSPLNWHNQVLVSVGLLLRWTPQTELRAGMSYARNPVPAENLSPTFALIADASYTAGFAHRLNPDWELSVSGVYQVPNTLRYESPLFGASKDRWEVAALYITFSRRW